MGGLSGGLFREDSKQCSTALPARQRESVSLSQLRVRSSAMHGVRVNERLNQGEEHAAQRSTAQRSTAQHSFLLVSILSCV